MSSKIILYDSLGSPVELDGDALKGGLATAWATVDGFTGSIIESFNISNVTRTATGVYTVSLGSNMDNADYVIIANASNTGTKDAYVFTDNDQPITTGGFGLIAKRAAQTGLSVNTDITRLFIVIHGGKG